MGVCKHAGGRLTEEHPDAGTLGSLVTEGLTVGQRACFLQAVCHPVQANLGDD